MSKHGKKRSTKQSTSGKGSKARKPGIQPVMDTLEPRQLLSAPYVWTPSGIGGTGATYWPSFNLNNPDEMYINTDMGQVWHTVDGAETWETLDKNLELSSLAMRGGVQFTTDTNIRYSMTSSSNISSRSNVPMKSTDAGTTWEPCTGWTYGVAYQLFADPNSTNRLVVSRYASNGSGNPLSFYLYYSNDGGATFSLLNGVSFPVATGASIVEEEEVLTYRSPWIAGVVWDNHDSDRISIATTEGLFTTTSGGSTWTRTAMESVGLDTNAVFMSFTGASTNSTTRKFWCVALDRSAYYDGYPAAIGLQWRDKFAGFYSSDDGVTWTNEEGTFWNESTKGLIPRYVAMQNDNLNNVWIGGGDDGAWPIVYKTTDDGANWTRLLKTGDSADFPGELPNENVQTHGFGYSGDKTWDWTGTTSTFTVLATDPDYICWTTSYCTYISTDGGVNWRSVAADSDCLNPAGAATPKNQYYSGTSNETAVWDMAFSTPTDYVATASDVTLQISHDAGGSWKYPLETDPGTPTYTNAYYQTVYSDTDDKYYAVGTDANNLYIYRTDDYNCENAADNNNCVFYSSDNGDTWNVLHEFGFYPGSSPAQGKGYGVKSIALDPEHDRAYVTIVNHNQYDSAYGNAPMGGIWVSNNFFSAGVNSTWAPTASQPTRELDSAHEGEEFAFARAQDLKILSDGTLVAISSLRTTSSGEHLRGAFSETAGVWISTDGGATWIDRSGDLNSASNPIPYWATNITIDPENEDNWIVSTMMNWGQPNIWATSDRGQTWTAMNFTPYGYTTFIRPGTHELYIGSYSEGMFYCDDYRSMFAATPTTPTISRITTFPFGSIANFTQDPYNPNILWVQSFGAGAWYADVTEIGKPGRFAAAPSAVALSPTEVQLTWQAVCPLAYGYDIQQSADNTNWSTVYTTHNGNDTNCVITGLSPNTQYYFRVVPFTTSTDGATIYRQVHSASTTIRTDASGLAVYEGFGYTAGASLNGQNGGSGWATAWTATSGSTLQADTYDPANPPAQSNPDNALVMAQNATIPYRQLSATIAQTGTVTWLGFEFDCRNGAGISFGTQSGYRWEFVGNGTGTSMILHAKSATGEDWLTLNTTLTTGSKHFIAMRVEVLSSGVAKVKAYLDPTPGKLYPDNLMTWTCSGHPSEVTLAAGLIFATDMVYLKRAGDANSVFDELRIGYDYASVAPAGSAINAPASPSDLTATAVGPHQIDFSWTDNATNEEGYVIQEYIDSSWTTIDRIVGAQSGTMSYSVTDIPVDTSRDFRIQAFNAGNYNPSSWVTVTNTSTLIDVPVAATDLTAEIDGEDVILTWDDNATNETGYYVEYTDNSRPVTDNDLLTWTLATTTAANATTYTVTGQDITKSYFYRVRPINDTGVGAVSNYASTNSAPTDLSGSGASQDKVNLAWTDTSPNENGFAIQKSLDYGHTWTDAGTAAANATRFTVTGLSANTQYWFRIRATAEVGDGFYSTTATARTLGAVTGLAAYDSFAYEENTAVRNELIGQDGGYGWSSAWTWTSGSKLCDISTGSMVADNSQVANNLMTYGNKLQLTGQTAPSRTLQSTLGGGDSGEVWGSYLFSPTQIDSVPYGFMALTCGDKTITIGCSGGSGYLALVELGSNWWYSNVVPTLNSTHLLVFKIAYGAGTTDKLSLWLDPDPTAGDPGTALLANKQCATNLAGVSVVKINSYDYYGASQWDELRLGTSYSAVVPAKLPVGAPSDLQATPDTDSIHLSWTAGTTQTGYHVERSTSEDSGYSLLTTVSGTSFEDTTATTGVPYYYRVSSYTITGDSLYTDVANATITGTLATMTVAATDASAAEPSNTGTFTITRSVSTNGSLTVNYTLSGTATNGTDYNTLSGSVTFGSGETTKTVTVTPINDSTVESSETVILTLATGVGYDIGTPSSDTVNLADNDSTVTIAATDASASEPSDTGTFTLTRSGYTTDSLTVNYNVSGTATGGTDYNTLSGTATFGAGQSTTTVTVTPIDDAATESTETVILTLASGTDYAVGTPSSDTVNLADNDSNSLITVAATDASAAEPSNTGTFTLTRSANTSGSLTVYYNVTGTATSGTDYNALSGSVTFGNGETTKTITVTPINDNDVESTETVIVTLASGTGYDIGTPSSDTVNLADNDSTVTIAATDASAAEPSNTGTFTLTRSGYTTDGLTVNYNVSGTGTNGTDYSTLSGTATFTAGQSTTTVTVTPTDDSSAEATETVIVTLASGTDYVVGTPSSDTVNLADNDTVVTVAATDAEGWEYASDVCVFTFSRDYTSGSLTVNYAVSGTATNGTDYSSISGSVTFGNGEATKTVTITPTDDATVEGNETVILTVSSDAAYTVGTPSSATVTIADDTLIAYDGFDYSTSYNLYASPNGNGGTGWSNSWSRTNGDSDSNTPVVSGSLSAASPANTLTTIGNSISSTHGAAPTRTTTNSFGVDATNTTVWASFLGYADFDYDNDGVLEAASGARLWIGTVRFGMTGQQKFGIMAGDTQSFTSDTYVTDHTTYFMVLKLVYGSPNYSAYLWVNPTPGITEPSTGTAVKSTTSISPANFTSTSTIKLNQGATWYSTNRYDEVRVGRSYADVAQDPPLLDMSEMAAVLPESSAEAEVDAIALAQSSAHQPAQVDVLLPTLLGTSSPRQLQRGSIMPAWIQSRQSQSALEVSRTYVSSAWQNRLAGVHGDSVLDMIPDMDTLLKSGLNMLNIR